VKKPLAKVKPAPKKVQPKTPAKPKVEQKPAAENVLETDAQNVSPQ
jgi:hypothetical protein